MKKTSSTRKKSGQASRSKASKAKGAKPSTAQSRPAKRPAAKATGRMAKAKQSATGRTKAHATHDEADRDSDRRLAKSMADNAGDEGNARHRQRVTAVEDDHDGALEDDEEQDLAVAEETAAEAPLEEPETREKTRR